MTIEEKLKSLNYNDRIFVEIIENILGLSYTGSFKRNNGEYMYMIDDNGKNMAIPKSLIKDITKV